MWGAKAEGLLRPPTTYLRGEIKFKKVVGRRAKPSSDQQPFETLLIKWRCWESRAPLAALPTPTFYKLKGKRVVGSRAGLRRAALEPTTLLPFNLQNVGCGEAGLRHAASPHPTFCKLIG